MGLAAMGRANDVTVDNRRLHVLTLGSAQEKGVLSVFAILQNNHLETPPTLWPSLICPLPEHFAPLKFFGVERV
jgi:hypothetical protein